MNRVWEIFGLSLLLTQLCELPVALLFHAGKKDMLLVLLVNSMTNPIVVLLSLLTANNRVVQVVLELLVIGTEAFYFETYARCMKHRSMCALCCNLVSYGAGLLLSSL